MDRIKRESRSIKIQPAILRKARIRAIESEKTLGEWLEQAIEEKVTKEERERPDNAGLSEVRSD